MRLNYSSENGQFIFDSSNETVNSTFSDDYKKAANDNITSNVSVQDFEYPKNITNIGLRREDMFYVLIVKGQKEADALRLQKLNGDFENLADYKYPDILENYIHSFYKFSGQLGTLNFAHTRSRVNGDKDNLFG